MRVTRLGAGDIALIAAIDRSDHVDVEYAVVDGQLAERPVFMADIPTWDPSGTGPHTVAEHIAFCGERIAKGGVLNGAFDDDRVLGLAVVNPSFEPRWAWLAWLHVNRADRRSGVARAL